VRHDRGTLLVSPRDKAGFVAAIRARAPRVEVAGLPEATIDLPPDPTAARRGVRIAAGAAVIEIGAVTMIGGMLYAGTRPPDVSIGPRTLAVRGVLGSATIPTGDILMVIAGDQLPPVGRKLFGFAALGSMRGRFRVEGLGDGYVFAERGKPYVLVRTPESFVLVGFTDPARTRRFYDDLRAIRPAR
jgi:hypothetical protein